MSVKKLLGLTEKYLRRVIETVSSLAKKKKGREILGPVRGRPETENLEIGVDRICEKIFQDLLADSGLPVLVFSEHDTYGPSSPEYYCGADLFDGSSLYQGGLKFEWYSVLSFFDLEGEPLAGGTADIINKEIYLADCEQKRCFLLELNGREGKTLLPKPRKRRVIDEKTWIAAYVMISDYYLLLEGVLKKLWGKFPHFRLWPNGGAGIYHHIAAGRVSVYFMPDEPYSEINPGLVFPEAAGYPVVSIKPDGKSFEPFRFLPGKQEERVPFFIAAASENLIKVILEEAAEEIKEVIEKILEKRERSKEPPA